MAHQVRTEQRDDHCHWTTSPIRSVLGRNPDSLTLGWDAGRFASRASGCASYEERSACSLDAMVGKTNRGPKRRASQQSKRVRQLGVGRGAA